MKLLSKQAYLIAREFTLTVRIFLKEIREVSKPYDSNKPQRKSLNKMSQCSITLVCQSVANTTRAASYLYQSEYNVASSSHTRVAGVLKD